MLAVQDDQIRVRLELTGPSSELRQLHLSSGLHGGIAGLSFRDGDGAVPYEEAEHDGALVVRLGRAVVAPLIVTYTVASAPAQFEDPAATTFGPDRIRVSGETAFLLPTAFDARELVAQVHFDSVPLTDASVASSFGAHHPAQVHCSGEELRHASFLVGKLNRARFQTHEAIDEWAWIEVLGFDARPVAGEAAALRTELDRYFDAEDHRPFVALLLATPREDGGFSVVSRGRGILAQVSVDSGWSAAVRIAFARELFRPWFGRQLRLASPHHDASHSELWFNEGMARTLARELLYRFGMLTVDEYLREVNELVGTLVLSDHRGTSLAIADDRSAQMNDAYRALIARGAVYGISIAGLLRSRKGLQDPLDLLVRDLFTVARRTGQALSLTDWFEVVGRYLPDLAEREYRAVIERGELPTLPQSMLGSCLVLRATRYERFSVGLDVTATRAGGDGQLEKLDSDGPAARAGARTTDRFVALRFREGDPTTPVELDLTRGGRPLTIKYRPVASYRRGPGWSRVSRVPDSSCH